MENNGAPPGGVLFDNKTQFYLRWSQEQERWVENFASRILEAFEKECTFVEELLKKSLELKRNLERLAEEVQDQDVHLDRGIENSIIQEMGTPQYFTHAARNVIRNRSTQISFCCTVLPDFMIPVDAMAEFHWYASYNTHLLSDSPKGGCFGMECEVVLGTDTYAYFKTGHQRFCNEVRRKVVEALMTRFDSNQWSFQPKFFVRNIIDETSSIGGGGGGNIGFNCVIDMRLTTLPEGLVDGVTKGYARMNRPPAHRMFPGGNNPIAFELGEVRWGGGVPHRQRVIPREEEDGDFGVVGDDDE